MLKRIGVNTKSARFELRRFGSLLGKDDRILLHRVADRLVGHFRNRLQQVLQPYVFERRIDAHDDTVHVERLRMRQSDLLTGRWINGGLRARRHGIDQKVDSFLVRVALGRFFGQRVQHLRQRHAVEKRFVQNDAIQLVLDRLSSGACVQQIRGRKRIGRRQSFALARARGVAGFLDQSQIIEGGLVFGILLRRLFQPGFRLVDPPHFVEHFAVLDQRRSVGLQPMVLSDRGAEIGWARFGGRSIPRIAFERAIGVGRAERIAASHSRLCNQGH